MRKLTARQIEIMKLIAEGFTSYEIGERLHLATSTVKNHRQNIMIKIGGKNMTGALVIAIREGLI